MAHGFTDGERRRLKQLPLAQRMRLDAYPSEDLSRIAGFYALKLLKKYGNAVISDELIGSETIEDACDIIGTLVGTPIRAKMIPADAAKIRNVYILSCDRAKVKSLPPKMYSEDIFLLRSEII